MGWRFLPARVGGIYWTLFLASGVGSPAHAERLRSVAECKSAVVKRPKSLDGYACLLPHRFSQRDEVLRFLESRVRRFPEDPRPRLYRAIVQHLAGDAEDERDYARAAEQFAREGDVPGEFLSLTSHVSARCVYPDTCDEQALALLERAGELARRSGELALRQHWEVWRMKVALARGDFVTAEAGETRLLALGEPTSAFLRVEGLQARAYLAAGELNHRRVRTLSQEMLEGLG